MNPFVYLLLCAAAIFLMFMIIAALRAVIIKRKSPETKSAISYTDEEKAQYAQCLSEMIQVPTVSLRGQNDLSEFRKLQDVMKKHFPLIHEKLERTDIDGNLLYRWQGKDSSRPGILLMGHQDVVPAAETEWEHEPFSGAIDNGKIHGRGAMDCKCTVMSEFYAVEELLREGYEPPCDIYLASSVNEEISGGGAVKTVEYLKNKGIRLDAVLDEGGAVATGMFPGMSGACAAVGIVEKGYMDIKITAKGAGGHASMPPKNTPVARLSAFVNEVEKKRPFKRKLDTPVIQMFNAVAPSLSFPLRMLLGNLWCFKPLITAVLPSAATMGEAFLATTFCFTMSGGSKTPNVIPDEAYIICNMRPSLHQDDKQSLAILEKYAKKHDLTLEVIYGRGPSNTTDIGSKEFKYVEKCIKDCFPDAVPAPYYMTGGTDCRNYEVISDNCLRFCPIRLDKSQSAAMHAANENVGVDALAECVKFYKHYIKNHE